MIAKRISGSSDEIHDEKLLRAHDAILTEDERNQRDRYRFEKDQHSCLETRALVRTVLSKDNEPAAQSDPPASSSFSSNLAT